MTTSAASRNVPWMDGVTVAAQDLRLGVTAADLTAASTSGTTGIAACAGVRPGVGTPLACTWTSGLSFTLSAGICHVQGTASATAGMYTLTLDTTATLTCTTADPTNPRIDSVIAVVVDNGNNTSTAFFKILAGTPAVSPSAPTLPSNALLLCNIAVAANASTLSAGVFTDERVWSVATGGILPFLNAALGATVGGQAGTYLDDQITGRLRRLDSSGVVNHPKVAAFSPLAQQNASTSLTSAGSFIQLANVSLITDGNTEIEIYGSIQSVFSSSQANGDLIQFKFLIDGAATPLNSAWQHRVENSGSFGGGGGSFTTWATPANGSHTVSLMASATTTGYAVQFATLRVSASHS